MGASESVTQCFCPEALTASRPKSRAISTGLLQKMSSTIEVTADLLTCIFGTGAAYFLAPSLYLSRQIQYPLREAAALSLSVSLLAVLLLHRNEASLYYIRNRGFFVDIAILIHTLFFALWEGV